ncbi:uncharacterized protein LOC118203890 [Stegodyphus dumicola]|uniref:uncharacterized protein LOC118203890 n=1 Tax=Stegodyphus dumicola TaxID=202533 RepID=UPI0015B33AED|nr:uncharacterized protein LOC118203890 [Stegodyphus dumicola]XP_035232081.1 uncharacterized protein LOC118203890 [Stegodyphus dumicola]
MEAIMERKKGNGKNKQTAYSSKEKYSSAAERTFNSETEIPSKTSTVTDGISDSKLTDNNRYSSSEHRAKPRLHCGCSGQNIVISETKMHGAISKPSCPKYYPHFTQVSEMNASKYPTCQTNNTVTKLTNNFNMHEKAKRFHEAFKEWENERQCTIQKLKKLVSEVHTDQLNLNTTKCIFKEINYHSRHAREVQVSKAVDFLASLTTIVSDVLDGFTSVAQAAIVDDQQTKFQEIMEHDAEISRLFMKQEHVALKNMRVLWKLYVMFVQIHIVIQYKKYEIFWIWISL